MKKPQIYKTTTIALVLTTSLAVVSGNARAADPLRVLTPLEQFSRCYTHITQLRLPLNHPKRAAVIAGTLSPVDACMQVLASANLNSAGTIATPSSVAGESLAVLQNFNNLHVNFTGNIDIPASVPEGSDRIQTRTAVDETEFALHYTYNLFTGASVKEIVTGEDPMEAVRSAGRYASGGATPLGVQTGSFQGVRKMPADKLAVAVAGVSINSGLGAGALSQSYLYLNQGLGYRTANGGLAMPRRWSKAVYQDTLCRPVPVLRVSDGATFVQPVGSQTSNTPSFRKSASCMTCHAAMDPLAGVARNFYFQGDDASDSTLLHKMTPSLAAETAAYTDSDSSFYKRPSNGRFRFRSYDGTLIDKPITSIAELGDEIAATNDFYACVASNYFHYFTGIRANLRDGGDTTQPAFTASELYYRNLVISMGQNLKSSLNLQSLIREIISSSPYKKDSLRSDGN